MTEALHRLPTPDAGGGTTRHALPSQLLHDLRTPLNHIIGYSELLMEQAQEEGLDALVPEMKKVRVAGGQLLALINDNFSPILSQEPAAATDGPYMAVEAVSEEPTSSGSAVETAQGVVLVVDDDAANRDVLARRLKLQGYAVATAENGRQALEMMRGSAFDLLLLDIIMPEMDGFEVLKRLKADDRLQHIPVIMISAMSEMDSAVRCIEMGAEDYLPKPFDPTLLKARTVACLERKRAHDHRRQAAVLDERNRIAREIHDTLAQTFTGILLELRVAKRIADKRPEEAWNLIVHASELAQQGLTEARRSVWDLQPEGMEYRDLAGALALNMERLAPGSPAHMELRIHGSQRDLSPSIGMDLFRIGQEALTNALRHARPRTVAIDLTFEAERVVMCVHDDGQGFDLNHQADSGGFGLVGMSQRAERLGGRLTIASQPGRGTEVAVWAPIAPAPEGME